MGQVFCLRRTTTVLATGVTRTETVYGVTSLAPAQAPPARLLALVRAPWTIANRLHWVRDVTFGEDASQVRSGAAPQVCAGLRNLGIRLLRRRGARNLAAALRTFSARPRAAVGLVLSAASG